MVPQPYRQLAVLNVARKLRNLWEYSPVSSSSSTGHASAIHPWSLLPVVPPPPKIGRTKTRCKRFACRNSVTVNRWRIDRITGLGRLRLPGLQPFRPDPMALQAIQLSRLRTRASVQESRKLFVWMIPSGRAYGQEARTTDVHEDCEVHLINEGKSCRFVPSNVLHTQSIVSIVNRAEHGRGELN